jgi:serine/threonine protein kinase
MVGIPVHPRPGPAVGPEWAGTDRYEMVRYIGRGGMGAVYEVRDRQTGQSAAAKTLLNATPTALYLFKQEFRTLADVDHPNLVRLYEFVVGEADRVFFTMELVHGTDFLSHVRGPPVRAESLRAAAETSRTRIANPGSSRPPPRDSALDSGRATEGAAASKRRPRADFGRLRPALIQLVDGVMALHANRKLHRDIKPSNVLVTDEGRVVLLDFGVAIELSRSVDVEMREDNHVVGTAAYMAPEQAFEEPSPACDWYSVGVMLYEAIVGRPPFSGSVTDVLTMKNSIDVLPPSEFLTDVPPDLDALCRALLQRQPAMRPAGSAILRRLRAGSGPRPEPIAPGRVPVTDAPSPASLAGRERHLQALRDAFDATRSGAMVAIRIGGLAGMGKSALAHRFLDELVEHGDAVVLRGRAYEREAVPYKAVDGIIDALSRYLMCLGEGDLGVVLPKDAWTLARLFPVLRRVPAIDALRDEAITDPQRVRRRAFRALRVLISSLARRRPLVLFVDDAQWGDTDSAALVLELLRPPHAPAILLAMTCREEEASASPFLGELTARCPQQVDLRDLQVGPLDDEEARHLALTLLGTPDGPARAMADAIAGASRGSPFLIEELARDARSRARTPGGPPVSVGTGSLEELVAERLAHLPDHARRCLEMLAVSGRPVSTSIARDASEIGEAPGGAIAILRARRFVRARIRDGREVLEILHDRIRETIVAQLSPATVREHHGRLASVLEAAADPDVEALATHLFGAGETEQAVRFAERAAEQAVTKLAFDKAAQLLRLTLETSPAASTEGLRLRKRLGEILEWDGRSAEAGRVYRDAAEGAPRFEKLELQRAAAEQFHASGLMDEGSQVLRNVLAAVGVWAPRSPLAALMWWALQHIWLRVRGLHFRRKEVRPEDQLKLDTLNTVALGFALVDHVLGMAMKARLLVVALRVGDPLHGSRGAGLVALDVASFAGAETATERAFLELSRRLIEQEPNPIAKYTLRVSSAVTLHHRGRFKEAKEALDPIVAMSSNRRVGQQSALLFDLHSTQFLGDMAELTDRYTRALIEAEERGNLFMSVALRTSTAASVWLAADDPATARRELREAMVQWAQRRFSSPEWRATVSEAEVDLYVGNAEDAYQRVKGLLRAMHRNFFWVYYCRALAAFIHGRAALASLEGLAPARRSARLTETRRLIRIVSGRRMPWTAPLASILEAGVARASGRHAAGDAALRTAIAAAEAANLSLHAAAARHELGLSIGGDEGGALVRVAEDVMMQQGVQAPARFAPMLVPGHRRRLGG